jgi:hypothetical protein
MSNRATPTTPSAERLATFRLDVKYTRIAQAFEAAGIWTILLKGPAFDQLLFDGTRSRSYADIDLLVDPARLVAAERIMEQRGFGVAKWNTVLLRLFRRGAVAAGVARAPHASAWIRDGDGFTVDLHATLPEVGASPETVWRVLGAHRRTITVTGTEVQTLDQPATALLIALHAAHHGPAWNRAHTDLQRACEVLERDCWEDALRLARDLRSEAAMGLGLGTTEEGRTLALELGLRTKPRVAYRLRWSGIAWLDGRHSRM